MTNIKKRKQLDALYTLTMFVIDNTAQIKYKLWRELLNNLKKLQRVVEK